jgi:hypothetical protein
MGDRDATDYHHALGYGDTAVEKTDKVLIAQAEKAVKPGKKGAAAAVRTKPSRLHTVRILLFDPKELLESSEELRNEFSKRVENDLNALRADPFPPDHLSKTLKLRFNMVYQGRNTTETERDAFKKFDYPIYLFNAHTLPDTSANEIKQIMQDHRIRNKGDGATQYKQAEEGWQNKNTEGLGIQPLKGYRKVGFIKVDRIFDTSTDRETAFTNIIKHELGHMFNKKTHGQGVMQDSILLSNSSLNYVEADKVSILVELARLHAKTEKELEKEYVKQTS